MNRWIRLAAWLIPAVAFVHACGGNATTDSTSGNTNWLKRCDSEADCGEGLSCQCNICQQTCTDNTDCDRIGSGSRCALRPNVLSCGDASAGDGRTCIKDCDTSSDCGRSDLECSGGFCIGHDGAEMVQPDATLGPDDGDSGSRVMAGEGGTLPDGTGGMADGDPGLPDGASDGAARCASAETQPIGPPYAASVSCHPAVYVPDACLAYLPQAQQRKCATDGGFEGVYQPADLPCGSCEVGDGCNLGVWAVCDCDEEGPRPQFQDDLYFDGWDCVCLNGTWSCWLNGISGSSCAACVPDAAL
jgi:hypothetical protein